MKVLKIGGGCLNSSKNIRNLPVILEKYKNDDIVIVISAFQKTTNFLEKLIPSIDLRQNNDKNKIDKNVSDLISYHSNIIFELLDNRVKVEDFYEDLFSSLSSDFKNILSFKKYLYGIVISNKDDYNFHYDQIVSIGEMLSSKIISRYLFDQNIENVFSDIRDTIITDSSYRSGNVDWVNTKKRAILNINKFPVVTQGFIAGNINNQTVTLGREGSDYSAAIIANVLNAEEVILFKDVDGIYNFDPKENDSAVKHDFLSYKALYYILEQGCNVVHLKTIKPLKDKNIILRIKNYNNINQSGTVIK